MSETPFTIVTGASQGIGRAIALRMAEEGDVVLVSRDHDKLKAVREEIVAVSHSCDVAIVVGDVTDPKTAEIAVASCNGRPVNLVCNAGIGKSGLLHEMGEAAWTQIMNVNVIGTYNFIKACLPSMLAAKGGTVCIISSVSGLVGSRLNTAYVASKHALNGLAKGLAKDYGEQGIVTFSVCPGYVETEMTERSVQKRMQRFGITREQAIDKIKRINPQNRLIRPEEIAEFVAFGCSGKVPAMSGGIFELSGGA